MENMREVLDNLKGGSIRSRQEALASVREFFSNDRIVATWYLKPNGKADAKEWLPVFQALFSAVLAEKDALTKKTKSKASSTTTTYEKRFTEAASAVRWLTERTVTYLNKKVVKALLEHFLQTIEHGGQFRSLFALDYIKALGCIVSYTAHLDWMDEDMWVRLIQMAFNFVLEDPLRTKFAEDELENDFSVKMEVDASDSHMFDDDDMVTDSEPSSSRKRNRSDSDPFSPAPSRRQQTTAKAVSREQLECMALLSILFRSPSLPLLSNQHPYLPSSFLNRMKRFLYKYTADTSLLHDYVLVLSSVLPSLSINKVREVRSFAHSCWRPLINLWNSKNKRVKENLTIILRLLFPFIAENEDESERVDMLYALATLFDKEAESKAMGEGLTLDSLRLELSELHPEQQPTPVPAFTARTFRAGPSFDATHAVAWAIFSLHADCIAKLYQLSESHHTKSTPIAPTRRGKRARLDLENPVERLLTAIKSRSLTNTRSCFLQTLIFFVNSHWRILHESLRRDVIETLLQLVSVDDTKVQSWIFLCFAAIVNAETYTYIDPLKSGSTPPDTSSSSWDSVWTNAIRRANTPAVCRAACHAAHAILLHVRGSGSKARTLPISQQRVLLEIEAMIKDLDVQGPPIPHDSICSFLKSCLQISSQDMRMYRLHLEDKVLTWLIDCWRPVEVNKKITSSAMVHDFTSLLAIVCQFSKQCTLIHEFPLPNCPIAQVLSEEAQTSVIKDFLLYAKLPEPPENTAKDVTVAMESKPLLSTHAGLLEPKGRERRISSFLMKVVDEALLMWDEERPPTADIARKCADLSVISLSYQGLLVLNGTQSDRRLIRSACNLIQRLVTRLLANHWTVAEKASIITGLDPLTTTRPSVAQDAAWEVLASPDIGSGIKTSRLSRAATSHALGIASQAILRVQEAFVQVSASLWDILRVSMHASADQGGSGLEDKDGFGAITTEKASIESGLADSHSLQVILIDACSRFLAVGSTLQSASGEPLRKKELVDVFLSCAETSTDLFLSVFPKLLQLVKQGYLHYSAANLSETLSCIEEIMLQYTSTFEKNSTVQLLVVQLMSCTLNTWASANVTIQPKTLEDIQTLCDMVAMGLEQESIQFWVVRDEIARLFSSYLKVNPLQTTWAGDEGDIAHMPATLLCVLNQDRDVRVRFRASYLCTRLFAQAREISRSPSEVYAGIMPYLTNDPENYEHVLTRMVMLGNVMIVSSETRRGPYWHLLETCLYTNNEQVAINYEAHIHSILRSVAQNLGFLSLASLFEAYAAQLAFSMCKMGGEAEGQITNVVQFPYRILGYENRLQSALATFKSFSPTNIWNNGQRQFADHCAAIGRATKDGIISCFGDIVGYEIARWVHSNCEPGELSDHLQLHTLSGDDFQQNLEGNIDTVIVFILQTIGDQDVSDAGPYYLAFKTFGNDVAASRTFKDLTHFRDLSGFQPHPPNLPAYPTSVILSSLDWLRYQISTVDAPSTTYHVLQKLFAQVERSSLINEQLRLINAIVLWVALHHSDFSDQTLLSTLIRGATSLFQQIDLRKAAQSILDWSFNRLRKIGSSQSMLSDILLRVACAASDHVSSTNRTEGHLDEQEILAWIDDQALQFSEVPSLTEEANKALAAWPYQPNEPLNKIYEAVNPQTIALALRGLKTTGNRFRLVSRMSQYAHSGGYPLSSFSSLDFWRLKRCIPLSEEIDAMDIDAFLDLLYLSRGSFNSLASEQDQSSVLSRRKQLAYAMQTQGNATQKKRFQTTGDDDTALCAVTLILLSRLHGDSAQHAHAAYQTLRQIGGLAEFGQWVPEHATELKFLGTFYSEELVNLSDHSLQLLQADDWIASASSASRWVPALTTLLAEVLSRVNMFYHRLIPTLQTDTGFAGDILPALVHVLLRAEQQGLDPQPNRQLLSAYLSAILRSASTDVACSRLIIDTVLHLRNFNPLNSKEALSYNSWLDIDCLLLARNAIACGMYTSAILFLELANESSPETEFLKDREDSLYQIYQHIDEPDGFYGIAYQDPHRNLLKRFEHENQWDRAFRFHGAALEAGSTQDDPGTGLVQSFHAIGLNQLANDVLQGLSSSSKGLASEIDYRLPWRTETWDLPDTHSYSGGAPLYLALRAIHRERDESNVDVQLRKGIAMEMKHLRELGAENFTEIRATVQELLCLGEISRWRISLRAKSGGQVDLTKLEDLDTTFDFSVSEGILATRMSLLHAARAKAERQQIGTLKSPLTKALLAAEKRCVLNLSAVARSANQEQIALNSIIRAQRLETERSVEVSEEFANVLWCQKEEKSAVEYLDRLCSEESGTNPIPQGRKALILARLGSWSSQSCLKKPSEIQQDYFQKAADICSDPTAELNTQETSAEIFYEYAIFAEEQYHSVNNSPDVLRWKIYRDRKLQEIEAGKRDLLQLQPEHKKYNTLKSELSRLQKLYDEDARLYQTHHTSLNIFLNCAIEMYSFCLRDSDKFDQDAATRLCSLWFSNFLIEDNLTQTTISSALNRIPSHKFIFLAHQLSARMSTAVEDGERVAKSRCQEDLQGLLLRMCQEHPFHSLYQVYSLKGELQSAAIIRSMPQSQQAKQPIHGQNERMLAAADILERLRSSPTTSDRIKDIERLSMASIKWAKYNVGKQPQGPQLLIPDSLDIRKIQNMPVPVMTARLPVDLTLAYNDIRTITRFRSKYKLCGGKTAPKVTTCVDSTGTEFQQLFKGFDDLRQDAVMAQVFALVNTVLDRDRQTKRRNLSIRTYKIIPLEQQSGVLEFVENTSPMRTWLDRAHVRYHPKDLAPGSTGDELEKLQKRYRNSEKLFQEFEVLMKRIRPVMRHYFTEKHKVPISWFAMRLNYTRSVATTSIVGHVLGLGDRHTSNILMDNVSGDVVHIDLGIAFDQGKLLPVPELVPFRMTRDMVDGMGMSGTSGVFHRCAEETLRVIRDGSGLLMTVLEVFKHDPLHNWTVDKIKVERVQQSAASEAARPGSTIGIDMSSGNAEEAADRALTSVSRKLDKSLSVQYTVNQLIREATDTRNLARIFRGWNPLL